MFPIYLDENNMEGRLLQAFRRAGIEASTALAFGMIQKTDDEQLACATREGMAIYTTDEADFPRIHKEWLLQQRAHSGIIIVKQRKFSVGEQTRRLLRLMKAVGIEEMQNRLEYLSNW